MGRQKQVGRAVAKDEGDTQGKSLIEHSEEKGPGSGAWKEETVPNWERELPQSGRGTGEPGNGELRKRWRAGKAKGVLKDQGG